MLDVTYLRIPKRAQQFPDMGLEIPVLRNIFPVILSRELR